MSKLTEIRLAELSRRSVMRNLALTAGGAAMLATTIGGIREASAAAKMTQKAVAYQDKPQGTQRCDNCTQFQGPSSCKVVEGNIDAGGWCKIYVKKPA